MRALHLLCTLCFGIVAWPAFASPVAPDPVAVLNAHAAQLTAGPANVRLHEGATLQLKPGHLFAPPAVLDKMMVGLPTPPSQRGVLGLVVAPDTTSGQPVLNWQVAAIQWLGAGHIKDQHASFDSSALLARLQQNLTRAQEGQFKDSTPRPVIVGWHGEPAYDRTTRQLTWSLTMQEGSKPATTYVVSHNVKLARDGLYAFSITAPAAAAATGQAMARHILEGITPADRHRYDDHSPSTDRIAPLTLASLVVGGEAVAPDPMPHPALTPVLVGLGTLFAAATAFLLWKRRRNS